MTGMNIPYFAASSPTTCSEAVRQLHEFLGSDWKEMLFLTEKEKLVQRHFDLGQLIRNGFNLHHNNELKESCGEGNADDASMVIVQALWEDLHKFYTIQKKSLNDNGNLIKKEQV